MRVLFVTGVFPRDFSRSVYGIFQRMRMWLDAIKSMGYELDILFLHPNGTDVGPEATLTLSQELLNHWEIHAHVVLCELDPRLQKASLSPFKTIFNTLTSRSHHPSFVSYSGDRQKAAFDQCMQRSPEMVFFQKIYSM